MALRLTRALQEVVKLFALDTADHTFEGDQRAEAFLRWEDLVGGGQGSMKWYVIHGERRDGPTIIVVRIDIKPRNSEIDFRCLRC